MPAFGDGWAAGIVAGLAFAVRETNIFLLAFLLPWIASCRPGGMAIRPAGRLTAFAAGAAVVILPFVAPRVWTADDRRAMLGHFDRLYRGEGEGRATTDIVGPLADSNAALGAVAWMIQRAWSARWLAPMRRTLRRSS